MTIRKLAGLGAAAVACATISAPRVEAQILMTQKDVEAELRVQWIQMKREMPRHPRESVQRYAQCIAFAIIDQVPEEWQNLDWEIIVFDNDARNAMVTPEGKIAVFSGLLEVADTPDELAAVLGHEVAHLTEFHVRERVRRAMMTGFAGAIGGAVSGFAGESQRVAQVWMQLPFQREQEREADLVGMRYMAEAGYDPRKALELWRDMGGDREGRPPEWLSTHPDPDFRMQDMARNLAPALVTWNSALDRGVRPRCRL